MNIQGFIKTTLLDYPGKVAAVLFLGGCNFRCPFCHNSSLVLCPGPKPTYSIEEILYTLKKRRKILDGVCISGGEPTLEPALSSLCRRIKSLGFPIKLDTNGTNPGLLRKLAGEHLIDYVAMDIKSSPKHYPKLTGVLNPDMDKIQESVQWLLTAPLPYEFRTTVVRELHTEEDFIEISHWLAGNSPYFLQAYQDSPQVIHPGYTACTREEMKSYLRLVKTALPASQLRRID